MRRRLRSLSCSVVSRPRPRPRPPHGSSCLWLTTYAFNHLNPERRAAVPPLRDQIVADADLVGGCVHGASVSRRTRTLPPTRRLNDSIRKITNGRLLPVEEPALGSTAHGADSRRYAHLAFLTATDIVRNLAKVGGGSKHFVFVSSAEQQPRRSKRRLRNPGGELARDVAELASVARLGNVTIRVVDARDLAVRYVLRPLKSFAWRAALEWISGSSPR